MSAANAIRQLPPRTFLLAIPLGLISALALGIPSDLVPNPVFGRPVAIKPIDYVIWITTASLIGLTMAIQPSGDQAADDSAQKRTIWGGFIGFLAIGCPVCNQAVVALLGVSGALSLWAPIQPLVGVLAIALVGFALKRRLETYQLTSCPIPT